MNTHYKSLILAISLLFALPASISAAPRDLDLTFGVGGIVITRGSNFNHLNIANAMAIQSDGKIVVVGDGTLGSFNLQAEFNRAFVAMQYYGYLRRTPETTGYESWLNYLTAHPGDFREMVRGFVDSTEYRRRLVSPEFTCAPGGIKSEPPRG